MTIARDNLWSCRWLMLGTLLLSTTGCLDAVIGDLDVCTVDGEGYALNEKFQAADGCNTCTCQLDGTTSCTELACPDGGAGAGPGQCNYGGNTYARGTSFPATDGCNTCTCESGGQVACTLIGCLDAGAAPGQCSHGGATYGAGASFPANDGCNTCTCASDGSVSCTEIACNGGAGCTVNGVTYSVGSTPHDALYCNGCGCEATGLTCDLAACEPASACTKGDRMFASGRNVLCEDGCNDCLCFEGSWSNTDAACAPLQKVETCTDADVAQEQVEVLYRDGDKLALEITTGGCPGTPPTYKLCFDGQFAESFPVQARLRLVPSQTSNCLATIRQQKVFDLGPLREDYQASYGNQPGTISVGLENARFLYTF